jgi:hypothetical protein
LLSDYEVQIGEPNDKLLEFALALQRRLFNERNIFNKTTPFTCPDLVRARQSLEDSRHSAKETSLVYQLEYWTRRFLTASIPRFKPMVNSLGVTVKYLVLEYFP